MTDRLELASLYIQASTKPAHPSPSIHKHMSAECSVGTRNSAATTVSSTSVSERHDEGLSFATRSQDTTISTGGAKGKARAKKSPKLLNLDDAVWLTDPISGVLQGVVIHLEDETVWVQITGTSLGQYRQRQRAPRKGLSVHVERKSFVTAPIEKVYLRFVAEKSTVDPKEVTIIDTFIEQRQSILNTDFPYCVPKKKSQAQRRFSWAYFRRPQVELLEGDSFHPTITSRRSIEFAKKKSILCERDLACLEHVLSSNESIAFCLWDPLLPDTTIILASPAFLKLTGYPPQKVLNSELDFLQGEQTDTAHTRAMKEAFRQTDNLHLIVLHYGSEGEPFFHRLFVTPLCDERQRVRYYLSIHGKATPTDAARINHREGWPMPAIFNLKGGMSLDEKSDRIEEGELSVLESGDESEAPQVVGSEEQSVVVPEVQSVGALEKEGALPSEGQVSVASEEQIIATPEKQSGVFSKEQPIAASEEQPVVAAEEKSFISSEGKQVVAEENSVVSSEGKRVVVSDEKSAISSDENLPEIPAAWLPDFSLHAEKKPKKTGKKKKSSRTRSPNKKRTSVDPPNDGTEPPKEAKSKPESVDAKPHKTKKTVRVRKGSLRKKHKSGTRHSKQSKESDQTDVDPPGRVSSDRSPTPLSASGKMPPPRSPGARQVSLPRTPGARQASPPRSPAVRQVSPPQTPNTRQASPPRTPSPQQERRISPQRSRSPRHEKRHSHSHDSGSKSPRRSLDSRESGRRSPRRSMDSVESGRRSPRRSLDSAESGRKSPRRSLDSCKSGRKSPRRSLESTETVKHHNRSSTFRQDGIPSSAKAHPSSPPAGTDALCREKSIGDLHDMLFSQPSGLSATHHTMTSFESLVEIEDCDDPVVLTPQTPTKPKVLAGTQHSTSSISDIHKVLFSQPNPLPSSYHTVTSRVDDAVTSPTTSPPAPVSPVSLASAGTHLSQRSVGSISEVHSVLFSQQMAALSTTEHTLLSFSNE